MLTFRGAVAAHATCYEKDTKMMALKAVNAFWNPYYYDPNRRTLTKQLIYVSEIQLRDEIRSLVYLAKVSNRSLIIPNVLGKDDMSTVGLYKEMFALWPGFRVVHLDSFNKHGDERFDSSTFGVSILEPSFYWRIQRDYASNTPPPTIVSFDSSTCPKSKDVGVFIPCKVTEIESKLLDAEVDKAARVVLNFYDRRSEGDTPSHLKYLATWASASVGIFDSYEALSEKYHPVPSLSHGSHKFEVTNVRLRDSVINSVRPCAKIFHRIHGNRSCFDKCK
jgi:hypothetical protein